MVARLGMEMQTSSDWSLRPYRPAQLEAVLAVFHDAVHGLAGDAYAPRQLEAWAPAVPDRAHWSRRLHDLNVVVAVAGGDEGDEHDVVGFIAWTDAGTIDLLYVAPRAAGRGLATRLYAAAEAALREGGCGVLRTDASDVARPFFAARGFVPTRDNQVERAGVVLRNTTMQKQLAE